MTKHRTLAEAYAANAADCAQHGHSWIAEHPGGPRTHCSWCGAHRTPADIVAERNEIMSLLCGLLQWRAERLLAEPDLDLLMQCACAHADARMCYAIRYGRDTLDLESGEYCYCYCHAEWDATEEAVS